METPPEVALDALDIIFSERTELTAELIEQISDTPDAQRAGLIEAAKIKIGEEKFIDSSNICFILEVVKSLLMKMMHGVSFLALVLWGMFGAIAQSNSLWNLLEIERESKGNRWDGFPFGSLYSQIVS